MLLLQEKSSKIKKMKKLARQKRLNVLLSNLVIIQVYYALYYNYVQTN